jgi:glycosyltransferase involved in cell wall biosynthesis
MKISFVIPAHNEEAAIGACVERILAEIRRAHAAAEVIVVNNASTDGTHAAAARYPGVRVVDELKKGIVQARARGFAESDGELVANIDADNLMPAGWIDTVLREFAADPNLVCLSGPLFYYDLSPLARSITSFFYRIGLMGAAAARRTLGHGAVVQGGNFVFRRDAMLRAGGYDTSIDFYGEDTAVGRRLEPYGRVKFTFRLPIRSSGRRLAKEGIVRTGWRYALNFLWVTFFRRPYHTRSTDIRTHEGSH